MQKIVVTGAQGLIGSHLIKRLDKFNIATVPIDIRESSPNSIGVNIIDFGTIKEMVNNCTGIVHLAAISRVVWGEADPVLCRKVNVDGTKNIIKACLETSSKPWMIYASSREVYGQSDTFPVDETSLYKPHNHYAKSKVEAEVLVNEARQAGLKTSILRFSNVFGGVDDHIERVVPAFCLHALNHLPLQVQGKDSLLDFTYVEDVVNGIIQTIQYLSSQHDSLPAIHFTTGKATSLHQLAQLVISLSNSRSDIILKPNNAIYPTKFYGDNSRAKALLGWQPEYDIQRGIATYLSNLQNTQAKRALLKGVI